MQTEITEINAAQSLTVVFGKERANVGSYAEASKAYRSAITARDIGASKAPACRVFKGKTLVATVSYNGRVWAS